MDLLIGISMGLVMGSVIGMTVTAMMCAASKADTYQEMYRVIREREELDKVEVAE